MAASPKKKQKNILPLFSTQFKIIVGKKRWDSRWKQIAFRTLNYPSAPSCGWPTRPGGAKPAGLCCGLAGPRTDTHTAAVENHGPSGTWPRRAQWPPARSAPPARAPAAGTPLRRRTGVWPRLRTEKRWGASTRNTGKKVRELGGGGGGGGTNRQESRRAGLNVKNNQINVK